MTKILIVDDELKIREVVREYAQLNGYSTVEAKDGLEAIEIVEKEDFDCIILDVMMPRVDGFSACKRIKAIKNIPVIMLSARQEEYDKLFGFELGVDDYVVKPFSPKELMARINALIERSKHNIKKEKNAYSYEFGGLIIDIVGRVVTVDKVKAHLTPKEIDLLIYLVKNKNVALSRASIVENVWNYEYYGEDRTVDSHIKMLRHNLGKYRSKIVTVRGMGYKFEE
ncbi:MAG: response regulator transcription factor [Anaerorhabdus sp.]